MSREGPAPSVGCGRLGGSCVGLFGPGLAEKKSAGDDGRLTREALGAVLGRSGLKPTAAHLAKGPEAEGGQEAANGAFAGGATGRAFWFPAAEDTNPSFRGSVPSGSRQGSGGQEALVEL